MEPLELFIPHSFSSPKPQDVAAVWKRMLELGAGAPEEECGLHGPLPPEMTGSFSPPPSVTLMDTSMAQGELGWLLDPPEDGVSVREEGSGMAQG